MEHPDQPAMLPAGLHDTLPPDAAHEAQAIERLMALFEGHGFERVKPPLIQFEEGLLSGAGAALEQQTFRLMDPVSQRMLAVRPDMTPQIARIATVRLRNAPRPLRLGYAGQILRIKGSQLRPERQFAQVGCELIGTLQPVADAEVILLAVEGLRELGAASLSVDLCVPTLVPTLLEAMGADPDTATRLRAALDKKDDAAVRGIGGAAAELCAQLMAATGSADRALPAFTALDLPPPAEADRRRLVDVVRLIRETNHELTVTIDPVERRGFEYQTGVSFTLFARGVRGELGRGGRYRAGVEASEPACGVTLFMDTVLRAIPTPGPRDRVFLPVGTPAAVVRQLRDEGWVTIAGLEPVTNTAGEARRLGCSHAWVAGAVRPVE